MDTGVPFASAEDFYRFINGAQDEIVCKPGERFFYHNGAWRMLGHIIQEKSGVPFHVYMKQNVLEPLGMARSTLDVRAFERDADHIVPQLKQADGSNKPAPLPLPVLDDNPEFSFIAGRRRNHELGQRDDRLPERADRARAVRPKARWPARMRFARCKRCIFGNRTSFTAAPDMAMGCR